jgi:hypothetical protein
MPITHNSNDGDLTTPVLLTVCVVRADISLLGVCSLVSSLVTSGVMMNTALAWGLFFSRSI